GKVWAQGGFTDLCEKFGVGTTRVSTDKPKVLAKAVRKLDYVKQVSADVRGMSVDVPREKNQQLYEDVLEIAKSLKAKVSGIESGTASLEELFNLAVEAAKEEDA
ncbi:MAG: hypothetical protein NWF14_08445, partial [Candidatus Bathyarchaeota archaeon]|nr:hypothetical protein [Candidatus Bathyarchaeota archaeon]